MLHRSGLFTVEESSVAGEAPMPRGFEPAHQLVLPYYGLFAYGVGQQKWLIDSNKVLFILPGWEFQDEQPVRGLGHGSVLINACPAIIEEIHGSGRSARTLQLHAGSLCSSPQIQLITQSFLGDASDGADALRADELAVRALRLALQGTPERRRPSARTVDKAKQFLHAHGCERLCLEEIAGAVGVSPIYLTQEFRRSEGIPLYQYQLSLRLARALIELPNADDLTGLALDLGFSSHSHFTFAFKKAFGVTPSAYRKSALLRGCAATNAVIASTRLAHGSASAASLDP